MANENSYCDFAGDGFQLRLDISIPATLEGIDAAVEQVLKLLHELEFGEEKEYEISLAVHEALVNAVVHGAKEDPEKTVRCCVASNEAKSAVIMVRDPGPGFDPEVVPDCRDAEHIFSTHGRGIFMMSKLMDKIEFYDRGTEVRLRKS